SQFIRANIQNGINLSELRALRNLLKNGRFDILHCHGARAGLYGRLAAQTLTQKPKIIFSIHGFATPYYRFPKKQLYLAIEKGLQAVTHHTICVSKAEQALFLKYGLTQEGKTSVIHPGIPLERFSAARPNPGLKSELGFSENSQLILSVCRLNIPRDFDTLLTAVSLVQQKCPDTHLLLVGDGPLRPQIEAKIEALSLGDTVHLLGFRQDIPDLLGIADMFTLTSYGWEGFPISTLEAQAMGCPVVVSDAGGAKEAVSDGQTGLVVPKKAPQALANAFLTLLQDDALRSKLGKNGEARAKNKLSRAKMVEALTAVYLDSQIVLN
ncbi:MAG: glycosyltransferase family 4 protein, partial [Chloroflexota bacterium]